MNVVCYNVHIHVYMFLNETCTLCTDVADTHTYIHVHYVDVVRTCMYMYSNGLYKLLSSHRFDQCSAPLSSTACIALHSHVNYKRY